MLKFLKQISQDVNHFFYGFPFIDCRYLGNFWASGNIKEKPIFSSRICSLPPLKRFLTVGMLLVMYRPFHSLGVQENFIISFIKLSKEGKFADLFVRRWLFPNSRSGYQALLVTLLLIMPTPAFFIS